MKTAERTVQTVSVLPKQHDFIGAEEYEVLYSGAFGAGKSRAVAMKLAMRASKPGAHEGLCRKELSTLKATTLQTLLEPDGGMPPVLPKGSYKHNKSERTIHLHGGGCIYYFGLDDESGGKVGSLNLSGCGIDQAEELTETDWNAVRGRVRRKVSGLALSIYGACNPGAPTHHLAIRFGLDGIHQPAHGCRAITTCTFDNPFLPPEYVANISSYTGAFRLRNVEGKWVQADGLVYSAWDRQLFVKARSGPWKRTIIGCDFGFTNPTALLVVCIDDAGRMHVADEFYESNLLNPAIIEETKRLRALHNAEKVMIDPSAAALRADMTANNVPAYEADNDVPGGLMTCQKFLALDGDGVPMFTVAPHCKRFIAEIEAYVWATGAKEKPKKSHDHAMDAWRYATMELAGRGPVFAWKIMSNGAAEASAAVRRSMRLPRDNGWTSQDEHGVWNEVEIGA